MFQVDDIVVRLGTENSAEWAAFCKKIGANTTDHFFVQAAAKDTITLGDDSSRWLSSKFTYAHLKVRDEAKGVTLGQGHSQSNLVTKPAHYQFFPDVEAIEIIASSMTVEGFAGYCMGNRLKYRLRAGNKDKLDQDIAKSDFYLELFSKHKHLCKRANGEVNVNG